MELPSEVPRPRNSITGDGWSPGIASNVSESRCKHFRGGWEQEHLREATSSVERAKRGNAGDDYARHGEMLSWYDHITPSLEEIVERYHHRLGVPDQLVDN